MKKIIFLCFLFMTCSVSAENFSGKYILGKIGTPPEGCSGYQYTVDKKDVSLRTARALYQILHFAYNFSHEDTDAENSLYAQQFGSNPSNLTVHRGSNSFIFIQPNTIEEMEWGFRKEDISSPPLPGNLGLYYHYDIDSSLFKDIKKIIQFRKAQKVPESEPEHLEYVASEHKIATKLLKPILEFYKIKVQDIELVDCN